MEFRILEIKDAHMCPRFKPQYKNSGWFSSWRNISNTKFTNTIYCSVEFSYLYSDCVCIKWDAQKVIEEFKEYLQRCQGYTLVHNYNTSAIKITPKNENSRYVALDSNRNIIVEGTDAKEVADKARKLNCWFSIFPIPKRKNK